VAHGVGPAFNPQQGKKKKKSPSFPSLIYFLKLS
jgi:hypothetical protein